MSECRDNNVKELKCYVQKVTSYDYSWHEDMFEIDVLLAGQADYSYRHTVFHLEPDDIIIINPGDGYASIACQPGTIALVLHFPRQVFRDFIPEGMKCDFYFVSDETNRNASSCRELRWLIARIALASTEHSAASGAVLSGAFDLLRSLLFERFDPVVASRFSKTDIDQTIMKRIINDMSAHYGEKITLEGIAGKYGYNRTYLSSAFKKAIGVGLYDYLTMIRFRHAIQQLAGTDKTLTAISYDCGFPEPKTFNRMFRDNFGILPAEYRERIRNMTDTEDTESGPYLTVTHPGTAAKLREYISLL
ncbi:MAG: helix-turn-helix transcriptional regulator [Solobacterium sp.]|nr:AraC family transcriptional regulator [Erysipelotrichaceae bacterium]MBQ9153579.1 helix-turn-helix transcriptional regulator [Solobacterium sp.]MBQ9321798.1 helix-turn-helix transcriptional regulator [Eubacterium sp.]